MKKVLTILMFCMSVCSVMAQTSIESYEHKLVDLIYDLSVVFNSPGADPLDP